MTLHLVLRLPGYEFLQHLHDGGQGIVYRALQTTTGRHVAIKVIRPELVTDAGAVRRFRLEGRAAAHLQHQNIVTLYDMGQEAGVHFLIMEYVEGVDLRTLVERQGALPIHLACDCIRQAAHGLEHAAERGLVHRDLKPSNLIRRTSDGLVKILDLGLARLSHPIENTSLAASRTAAGALLGTVDFMAPEQIENASTADTRSDLYSLGCTLYYLIAGQPPFPGENLTRKLDGHRWRAPKPLEQLRPETPRAVAAVCRRLMAKHPEDRYASPAELADVLSTISSSLEPGVTSGPGVMEASEGDQQHTPVDGTGSVELPLPFPPGYVGECRCFRGHQDYVTAVAFIPNQKIAASCSLDGEVRLWDIQSGGLRHVLKGHEAIVSCLRPSEDGIRLLSGGADGTIRTWDTNSGEQLRCVGLPLVQEVDHVAISPDGRRGLLCACDGSQRLWDLELNREIFGLVSEAQGDGPGFHGLVSSFSRDGKWLASGSRDGKVRIWDGGTGAPVATLGGHAGPVFGLDFSPDGRLLASCGHDQTIRLWDLTSFTEVRALTGHQATVRAVAFVADSQWLLSASNDHTVRLWDLSTGAELCRLEGHTDHVTSVAHSSTWQLAASGGNDRTVRFWQLPSACQQGSTWN